MTNPGSSPRLHCAVVFALFFTIILAFPKIGWPWHFVVPFSLYAALLTLPRLRRSIPPLVVGRLGGAQLGFAVLVAVATSGVLLGYQDFVEPDVKDLAMSIPLKLLGSAGFASIVFAVVNAVCEELLFRWLFWEAVVREWNETFALVATSVLFGLAHWQGYPPGPIGVVLAAIFGLLVGVLRWWTGGLGLTIACHIVADFTVFVILWTRST